VTEPPGSPEREAILQGLRDVRTAFDAARDQYEMAAQANRRRLYELLELGARAGLGRKAMARAAGMSLPSLRRFLDEDATDS
jgi:hypothetical protein